MARLQTIKSSFLGGEISPYSLGRVDLDRYHSCCESMQNYIALIQGGAQRRPGTRFIAQAMGPSRLIPFKFNINTAYVLEFGNQRLRFYKNDEQIMSMTSASWNATVGGTTTDGALTWTNQGFPPWRPYHTYLGNAVIIDSNGNLQVTSTGGLVAASPGTWATAPGAITTDALGVEWVCQGVPAWMPDTTYTTNAVVYTSVGVQQVTAGGGGQSGSSTGGGTLPYEIATPYDTSVDNLWDIKFAQFADIMYLVHPNHPPQKLNRLGDVDWILNQPVLHGPPTHPFDQDVSGTATMVSTTTTGTQTLGQPTFNVVSTSGMITAGSLTVYANTSKTTLPITIFYTGTTATSFTGCSGGQGVVTAGTLVTGAGTGGASLTPAATSGTGINFEASVAGTFLAGDVGKQIVAGAGLAYITAIDSPGTNATADILDSFATTNAIPAGSWFLRGSPQAYAAYGDFNASGSTWANSHQLGPGSVVDLWTFKNFPVAASSTTGTDAQVACFRAIDVGSYVVIGGGVGQILSLTSSSQVKVRLLSLISETFTNANETVVTLPISGGAWSVETPSFSPDNGYPVAVCFFQDRLCFAGTAAQPQNIWCSVTGDYENFCKGPNDDQAIDEEINSGFREQIQWLSAYQAMITAGTLESEYQLSGGNLTVGGNSGPAITPSNFTALMQSRYGVAPIQPIFVENYLLYVQRSRVTGYEMSFDIYHQVYGSKNLNLLSDIITTAGFKEMAYAQIPYRVLWFTDLAGNLVGLTYNKEQDVWGWHRHFTGQDLTTPDQFVSVTTIPDPSGLLDQTWFCTQRQVNNTTQYFIEQMDLSLYVDCGVSATGPGLTQVTGLQFLQGRSVVINADNAALGPYTVPPSGIIDFHSAMPSGATLVQVGLPYNSLIKTVRLEAAQGIQTSQGLNKRWSRIWVRVYNTLGITVNQDGGDDGGGAPQTPPLRTQPEEVGVGVPLFTGDLDVNQLQFDRDGRLLIQQSLPLPGTILSAFGTVEIGEN